MHRSLSILTLIIIKFPSGIKVSPVNWRDMPSSCLQLKVATILCFITNHSVVCLNHRGILSYHLEDKKEMCVFVCNMGFFLSQMSLLSVFGSRHQGAQQHFPTFQGMSLYACTLGFDPCNRLTYNAKKLYTFQHLSLLVSQFFKIGGSPTSPAFLILAVTTLHCVLRSYPVLSWNFSS